MRPSLARYFVKVLGGTAAINFAVNFALGRARYGHSASVVVGGLYGIGADTIVNAFIIGALTFSFLYPEAAREARSGRVRGGGSSSSLLGWIARHRGWAGVIAGLACAMGIGLPSWIIFLRLDHGPVSGEQFTWARSGFAAVVAVLVAIVTVLLAIAREADASDNPRWCKDPAATVGPTWPCDNFDKGSLALTSREHGSSATPTWQMLVRGALDPAHVLTALGDTVTRYPSLATRVETLDGAPPEAVRLRYATDPRFSLARLFKSYDVKGNLDELRALEAEHLNRYTDLYNDPPLTLTLIRVDDDHCRLLLRQHHALADGRAIIELMTDFVAFLDAARAGRRPSPEALAPIGRRPEVEALQLPAWRRVAWTVAGGFVVAGMMLRARLTPAVPLVQNERDDYRGDNRTLHWILPERVLDSWNAARRRVGVSLNSLLTAGLFVANQRRQRARGGTLGRCIGSLVMETRPRDGSFRSFANHLAILDVETDLGRSDDVAAIAQKVQADVDRQRARHTPHKRLLAERLGVMTLPVSRLARIIFESKPLNRNFDFSNLIALPFPTLRGDGFVVETMQVTTPVSPRAGIMISVIRYNGQLLFNFNYKASAVALPEVEALRDELAAILATVVAA